MENIKLKSTWQLLKEAWHLYGLKFKTAVGIMVVPASIYLILSELTRLSVLSPVLSQTVWTSVVKIILWFAFLYLSVSSIFALLFSVKDNIGARKAYGQALKNRFSYAFFLMLSSMICWSLLVGVSAITIIMVCFFSRFAYIFIFENKSGLEAIYFLKKLKYWKRDFFMALGILIIAPLAYFMENKLNDTHHFIYISLQLFAVPLLVFYEISRSQNAIIISQPLTIKDVGKIRKAFHYLSVVIIALTALIFLMFQGLSSINHDIPNPDDSDLQLSVVDIPKEQNSFYALMEAKDADFWPTDQSAKVDAILAGKELDQSFMDDILQKNKPALASFEKGVTLPIFQIPEFQNPKDFSVNSIIPDCSFLRNLVRLNSFQSIHLLKQGREKEAFDQSMKTLKMAQMIQDGQNSLIGYLIGLLVKETGLLNLRVLVEESNLSSAELLSYENELNKYKESGPALQAAFRNEYITFMRAKIEEIDPVFRGEKDSEIEALEFSKEEGALIKSVTGNFYYQPNGTKLEFIRIYERFIDNTSKRNYNEVVLFSDEIPEVSSRLFITNNAIGKIISRLTSVSFEGVFAKRFNEVFSVRGTQLLLALKAYKQDTGNLPNSLQELVPKYIPESMEDPFDGKALRYSAEKKIIYSVGKDLIDNGGAISADDWKKGDDLGFKVEF